MKISDILRSLEEFADPALQEQYDNAGLITGERNVECTGAIVCLDATEDVVNEAIQKKCNLIVSHHPIIFRGLKSISSKDHVGRTVIRAIKNDIAIYAIHTNLDNVLTGVNGRIANLLGLKNVTTLAPKEYVLRKLFTFVPEKDAEKVRSAIFNAGAGNIGNYSECSFNVSGSGTFKAGEGTHPYVGKRGERHVEPEVKIEVVFPSFNEKNILSAMKEAHPYEEVAYDVVSLENKYNNIGSGVVGELPNELEGSQFLNHLKRVFSSEVIRHTRLPNKKIQRVAVCGGAGSFLIHNALAAGADAFVTADMKYHDFFETSERMLIADIGHYESEQFTINLLEEYLLQKFPTFAVLKTEVVTNPVHYF